MLEQQSKKPEEMEKTIKITIVRMLIQHSAEFTMLLSSPCLVGMLIKAESCLNESIFNHTENWRLNKTAASPKNIKMSKHVLKHSAVQRCFSTGKEISKYS